MKLHVVMVDVIQGISDIDVHLSTPQTNNNCNEIHVEKAKSTNCSKKYYDRCP